jgi:hypothetical protein
MVIDYFHIPQKTNKAVVVQKPEIDDAVRQAVEEALRQAVPTIQYNNGNVYVNLTINIGS